jgi:hypothetical protein
MDDVFGPGRYDRITVYFNNPGRDPENCVKRQCTLFDVVVLILFED